MNKKKILYVFRTRRKEILDGWKRGKNPDSMLFGLNHLRQMGYRVDFFDYQYSLFNPLHWLFYPLEHAIIGQTRMGFKLDQAVSLLSVIKNYDVIVATADVSGLPLLWLKQLRLINKPVIVLGGATAGPLKSNPKSWVIDFYKKLYAQVDRLTCYAKTEVDFFVNQMGLPENKVEYIPYCADWDYFSKPSKLKRSLLVSAGVDASRDYATLLKAVKGLPIKVRIACRPENLVGLEIPGNVQVGFVDSYQKMRRLFQRARLVVVPLKEVERSAGQRVVLEAAAAKCPLIVSKVKGMTTAYKFRDKLHLRYVLPENPKVLRQKIIYLLKYQNRASKMGRAAAKFVKQHYTSKHLAENVNKLICEIT